jgi:hypothetical protein
MLLATLFDYRETDLLLSTYLLLLLFVVIGPNTVQLIPIHHYTLAIL